MTHCRANRRNPLALLLWAALLLFGQTAALAHQHFDAPGTSCAVCPLAQAQTAACDAAAAVVPPLGTFPAVDRTDSAGLEASPPRYFRSRAPPAA
jgi:hypothetical protein